MTTQELLWQLGPLIAYTIGLVIALVLDALEI